jgi:ATP-dependent Clp protease protease subunit
MGAVLLCAGAKENVLALPHSRVMIHQPSGGAQGVATDMEINFRNVETERRIVQNYLSAL